MKKLLFSAVLLSSVATFAQEDETNGGVAQDPTAVETPAEEALRLAGQKPVALHCCSHKLLSTTIGLVVVLTTLLLTSLLAMLSTTKKTNGLGITISSSTMVSLK